MMCKFLTLCGCIALTACVNTPNTKALVTPIGAVGIHSFAPPAAPDRMRKNVDIDGLDRVAAADIVEVEQ